MPRHIEISLNGIPLTGAVPLALIQQVYEEPAEELLTTAERAVGDGQTVIEKRRTRLTVAVTFTLAETRDLALRARQQQAAADWAADGYLTLSSRPGQRLAVICTRTPNTVEDRNYTAQLRAEFAAVAPPYWQDEEYAAATGSGASGVATLQPTGTKPRVPLEAVITPTGGTLNALRVDCGTTFLQFTGLNVAAGTPLIIGRSGRYDLTVTAAGSGKLSCRAAVSSDELLAVARAENQITWQADTACNCVFKARGLYR